MRTGLSNTTPEEFVKRVAELHRQHKQQQPAPDSHTNQRNVTSNQKGPGSHLHDILPEGESLGIKPEHIAHYAQAIVKWIAAGRPKRTQEEIEKLLAICKACKHYTKNGKCRKCGCCANASKIAVKNKLAMRTETCPIGLWGKEIQMTESTCQRCGDCCRTAVRLFPRLKLDEPAPEWMRLLEKYTRSLDTPKIVPCIFLTTDNRCALQDVYKPQACRDYQCKKNDTKRDLKLNT